jgi:PKD repeat protein
MTSLAGKILRIDPATGLGLADNPFFTGNPADHASRIWAMGLRNPFRFCLVPGTGPIEQLYVCNVGWETWEAVDACRGGENFGWPCNEGPEAQTSYSNINLLGDCDDPSLFTPPLWCYQHYEYVPPMSPDFVGQCTAGACVYTGTEYPSMYLGRVFLGDYASEWIRSLVVIDGVATQSDRFVNDAGHPVDITPDPRNGDLLYSALSANVIRRIRYTKADHPPVALATITPTFGPSPLDVSFDATASYDPEGGSLTYDWDLGDGTRASVPVLTHSYAGKGSYAVVLTVVDPLGETAALTQRIAVDDTPPDIVSIDDPAPGSFYTVGQPVAFDATVTDVEDDLAGIPVDVEWVVDLVHDHHVHPSWATLVGAHVSYVPPVHGEGVYLHVTLNATDSGGLTSSRDFVLYDINAKPEPHLVTLSNYSPRIGHSIQATGHVHYAGLGDADLAFDWGDGGRDTFRASHLVDCTPTHTYAAPGTYSLRFTTSNSTDSITVTQPVVVRPLVPEIAIFAPLVVEHFVPIADQWAIAIGLVDALHRAGFEGRIFGAGDQVALRQWMTDDLLDPPRDWLICLDVGASSVYAGKDDGSLAERWLEAGNGIVWTGFNPFSQYLTTDGVEKSRDAGPWALDELLDAATPRLVEGSGHMSLRPDGADLPSLQPFDSSLALMTGRLDSDWTIARLYASDGGTPPVSDALVLRNRNGGGEYAQFYCVDDATLPREGVLRDFLASHVYAHLPKGPQAFALVRPAPKETVKFLQPTLVWNTTPDATSWLVEVVTDAADAEPVFTATVLRSGTSVERTASVQVTAPLAAGSLYRWRVTARNDFGARASDTREFRFESADRHR